MAEKNMVGARLGEKELKALADLKEKYQFDTDAQAIRFALFTLSEKSIDEILDEFPDWKDFTAYATNKHGEDKRNNVLYTFIFDLMVHIKQLYDKYDPKSELPSILSAVPEAVKDLQKSVKRHELDAIDTKPDKTTPAFYYVQTGAKLYHITHGEVTIQRDGDYLLYKKEAFNLDGVSLESSTFIPTLFHTKPSVTPPTLPPLTQQQKEATAYANLYLSHDPTYHTTEKEADTAPNVADRTHKIKLYGRT